MSVTTGDLPMLSREEAFLSQFDERLRVEVLQFAKRVSKITGEHDLTIIIARKAACFVECLRSLNLVSYQGLVTTDRVLDMDLSWLAKKRIALVDDGLISGTTLRRICDQLQTIKCSVSVHVLCVNTVWWNKALIKPEKPYLTLGDNETALLCSKIVDSIAVLARPYAIDYPLYTDIRLSTDEVEILTGLPGWEFTDVASNLQRSYEIFSLTITPSGRVLQMLNRSLGWSFSTTSLVKLRLYGRWLNQKRSKYLCTLLPIVALDPLAFEQVDLLYSSILKQAPTFEAHIKEFYKGNDETSHLRTKAKLRLINYLIAARLTSLFAEEISELWGRPFVPREDNQNLTNLFPPAAASAVRSMASSRTDFFSNAHLPEFYCEKRISHQLPAKKYNDSDSWSVEAQLLQPFLDFYHNKELKARSLAKQHGKKVFLNRDYQGILNRLNEGYSFTDLLSATSYLASTGISLRKLVSIFLDRAIDRGIVVPTTTIQDGIVFRSYRHGEDVLFAEEQQKICGHMAVALSDALGSETCNQLDLHKAIVLLFRIGLEQKIFQRYDKDTHVGKGKVGIRFWLHGAIAVANSEQVFLARPDLSVTNILVKSGYLSMVPRPGSKPGGIGSTVFKVNSVPTAGVDTEKRLRARKIGTMLGKLLCRDKPLAPASINSQELTLLATCISAKDTAGALGAEISIIKESTFLFFDRYRNISIEDMSAKEAARLASMLRSRQSGFTALNSAQWKFQNFIAQTAWRIVERIRKDIPEALHRDEWESFWPWITGQQFDAIPDELRNIIRREAGWVFKVRFAWALLECVFRSQAMISTGTQNQLANLQFDAPTNLDQLNLPLWLDLPDESEGEPLHPASDNGNDNYGELLQKSLTEAISAAESYKRYSYIDGTELLDFLLKWKRHIRTGAELATLRKESLKMIDGQLAEANDLLTTVGLAAGSFGEPVKLISFRYALLIRFSTIGAARSEVMNGLEARYRAFCGTHKALAETKLRLPKLVPEEQTPMHDSILLVAAGPEAYIKMAEFAITEASSSLMGPRLAFYLFDEMPVRYALNAKDKTSEYYGDLFWIIANRVVKHLGKLTDQRRFNFLTLEPSEASAKVDSILNTKLCGCGFSVNPMKLPPQPFDVPFEDGSLKVFRYKKASAINTRDKMATEKSSNRFDVGIIAIVGTEMRAVLEGLNITAAPTPGKRSVRNFYTGTVPAKDGGTHSVVCLRSLEQGDSVMPAYQALRDEYCPRIMVLLGIAGAVHKKVKLCDVTLCEYPLNYDKRAIDDEEVKHRFDGLPPMPLWLRELYNLFEDKFGENPSFNSSPNSFGAKFRVTLAPIGSGGAIVKGKEAEPRQWLAEVSEKTSMIETEAAQFARQYYEDSLLNGPKPEGYLIIRGASDLADPDKDKDTEKKWRKPACDNALIFLKHFLSIAPAGFTGLIPRNDL